MATERVGYRQILLLLDGSAVAEQAVPHAAALAEATGGSIEVLRVVPASAGAGGSSRQAGREQKPGTSGGAYVENVVQQLAARGLRASGTVRTGVVDEEILAYLQESSADLVVICTRGEGGCRWHYGSIADRVLRLCSMPVLLVRASSAAADESGAQR